MSLERDARAHRDLGVEVEQETALPIVLAYRGALALMKREFDAVLKWIASEKRAGRRPSRAALERKGDLERALQVLEGALLAFGVQSARTVEGGRLAAVAAAKPSAESLVKSAATRIGIDTSLFVPPVESVALLDESLGSKLPLGRLFASLAPETADDAKRTILEGMLSGRNPRDIARDLGDALQVPRTRALTISRTEVLRSFRAASIATYRAHDDTVDGWQWLSALDSRTCVVCWSMHGTVHPVTEPFASHPNCRCSPIPVVGPRLLKPGAEEFAKLPESRQRETLGPRAYELYRSGQIGIADLVRKGRNEWGPYRTRMPLKDLNLAANAA